MGNNCESCCRGEKGQADPACQILSEQCSSDFATAGYSERFFELNDKQLAAIKKFSLFKLSFPGAVENQKAESIKRAKSPEFLYEGQMKNGLMAGKGHLLTSKGDFYVSIFKNNRAEGLGAVYFSNGDYFEGKLSLGQIEEGRMDYSDGTSYSGLFKNGLRDGKGTFIYKNGSKYEGSWKEGLEQGEGRVTTVGVWKKGVLVSARACQIVEKIAHLSQTNDASTQLITSPASE